MGRSSILFIVSGPSGAGKTTLVEHVLRTLPNTMFSVSYTTRPPRPGEEDAREYYFRSREEFRAMIERGELLEHANIFGQLYGTPRGNVEKAAAEGKDLVLDIDAQGATQVKAKLPEAVAIFLLPPSRQELERRLRARGLDSPEVIRQRLEMARREIENFHNYDYVIVNDSREQACREAAAIAQAERYARHPEALPAELAAARALAAQCRKAARAHRVSAILETFDLAAEN